MEISISTFGNNCQHQKLSPSWFSPPDSHKPRQYILEQAKKRVENFYWFPNKWLKAFRYWMRSERRESCCRLLQTFLHFMSLYNLQIGVPNPTGFRPLSLKTLAKHAGLNIRRAKRAQKDLIDAEYLTVERRYNLKDRKFLGLSSIRTLTVKLFEDLKINPKKLLNEQLKKKSGRYSQITGLEKSLNFVKDKKEKGRAWLRLILKHLKTDPP